MLNKRHRIIIVLGTHLLDTRREAGNGQNDNIANTLARLHAGKVVIVDAALAGIEVKEAGVVEVVHDGVGPDGRASQIHDTGAAEGSELAVVLHFERSIGDAGDDITQHGVTRLALDGPLAELDAAAVPVSPVGAVGVGLNTNDETNRLLRDRGGDPSVGTLDSIGVNVGVDAAAGKENQITEEVSFENGQRQKLVCLEDLGNRSVKETQQAEGHGVGDDFVDETRVGKGPGSLLLAKLELALGGGVFPSLPDVGRELGRDVVWESVGELVVGGHVGHVGKGLLGDGAMLLLVCRGAKLGGVEVLRGLTLGMRTRAGLLITRRDFGGGLVRLGDEEEDCEEEGGRHDGAA